MFNQLKATLLKHITDVSRAPVSLQSLSHIVVLRYDRIGDMIVSLPLCKAIKSSLPNCKLTMIASASNACITESSEYVDTTIIKPAHIFAWVKVLLRLRSTNPDLVIDLNHSVAPHTIFAIRIIGPKHAATPFKVGRWGVAGHELKMFDVMPPQHHLEYRRPIAEMYLDIARELGLSTDGALPYPLPKTSEPCSFSKDYVVLNIAGSRTSMRIESNELISIVKHVERLNSDLMIYVPSMPDNVSTLKVIFENHSNVSILEPTPSITPLLPIVQYSKAVITPDTALVHIACAYSVPLVAIYTSDDALYEQWRPTNNPNAFVVRSREPKGLAGYSLPELLSCIERVLT